MFYLGEKMADKGCLGFFVFLVAVVIWLLIPVSGVTILDLIMQILGW